MAPPVMVARTGAPRREARRAVRVGIMRIELRVEGWWRGEVEVEVEVVEGVGQRAVEFE